MYGRPATRLYGLFEVHVDESGKKSYVRLYPSLALPLARARRAFQNSLLAFALDPNCKNARELRPITEKK